MQVVELGSIMVVAWLVYIYIEAGESAKYKSGVTGSYLYIGQLYKTI